MPWKTVILHFNEDIKEWDGYCKHKRQHSVKWQDIILQCMWGWGVECAGMKYKWERARGMECAKMIYIDKSSKWRYFCYGQALVSIDRCTEIHIHSALSLTDYKRGRVVCYWKKVCCNTTSPFLFFINSSFSSTFRWIFSFLNLRRHWTRYVWNKQT